MFDITKLTRVVLATLFIGAPVYFFYYEPSGRTVDFEIGFVLVWTLIVIYIAILVYAQAEFGDYWYSRQDRRFRQAREYLERHKEITNEKYRELTGVSQSQATRDLDELEKQGSIKQIGKSGPHVRYKLIK